LARGYIGSVLRNLLLVATAQIQCDPIIFNSNILGVSQSKNINILNVSLNSILNKHFQ
jgi:hypothetical protein